jgi:hypothetical protein
MPNPRKARRSLKRATPPWPGERVRPGDTGAVQEGKAAALMIGTTKFPDGRLVNPYARALKDPDLNDEARGRYIELRNSWESGFASVPKSKRGGR